MLRVLSLACHRLRLTPAEAVSAATINGAHAVGLAERVGSIETGKQADLVFFDVPDYREIPYHLGLSMVAMTMKRGVVLYRRGEVRWPDA
jgi:imidazolonepropionase